MADYTTTREVKAGCRQCHGGSNYWFGKNAQGVAARHAKTHGHEVVVEVYMTITYRGRGTIKAAPNLFGK